MHASLLLLKVSHPQNEQSQPLCSSRQRCEARLQRKWKLIAFLIGARLSKWPSAVDMNYIRSPDLPALSLLLWLAQSAWITHLKFSKVLWILSNGNRVKIIQAQIYTCAIGPLQWYHLLQWLNKKNETFKESVHMGTKFQMFISVKYIFLRINFLNQ